MGITRRDLVGLAGGVAVGGLLSPMPWKLLDDSAIWTQNWSWIPTPARGLTSDKPSICTLCPAGCGLLARCVGPNVFGIKPVASNPTGGGALCPQIYGAHQLPYHPKRLRTPNIHGSHAPIQQAVQVVAATLRKAHEGNQPTAWLDERPGRLHSASIAKFAAATGGQVVAVPQVEERTLSALETLAGVPAGTSAYDFENAGVILSLGAPLLDGWGAASRLSRIWAKRTQNRKPWFIQVGSRLSRSAQLADTSYLIRPGSESALVAALAGHLFYDRAATLTGLRVDDLKKLATLLESRGPAIVVGGGEPAQGGLTPETERMVAALNIALGSVGRPGGIVARRLAPLQPPAPTSLLEIADNSLAVLVHDASSASAVVPDTLLRRKLAPNGTLVRFTAFHPENVERADILIPATTFLESADDSSGSRDAQMSSWSYSAAILTPPSGVLTPQAFLTALGTELNVPIDDPEASRKAKEEAIVATRRGQIYRYSGAPPEPLTDVATLRKAMDEGATWIDDPTPARAVSAPTQAVAWNVPEPADAPLLMVAGGSRTAMGSIPAVPLAAKLDQETRLLPIAGEFRVHSTTAKGLGLRDGDPVLVTTAKGEARGRLRLDATVIPGHLETVVGGPDRQGTLQALGAGTSPAPGPVAAQIKKA